MFMAEKELYAEKKSFFNFTVFEYNEKYNMIELVIFSLVSFVIPIFFGHPQLLIGTIINAILFRSALTTKFQRIIPLIMLPSIGALVGGALFGGFTPFLIYFMPMIWAGNALYVLTAKFISKKIKKNFGGNVLLASLFKSALLFGSAFIMVTFFGFPSMFLIAMGIMQVYTALMGGAIAATYTAIEQNVRAKK